MKKTLTLIKTQWQIHEGKHSWPWRSAGHREEPAETKGNLQRQGQVFSYELQREPRAVSKPLDSRDMSGFRKGCTRIKQVTGFCGQARWK